ITLAYRKRGANSHQFIVTDSGPGIPEEAREDLFKAFNSSRDISEGDGLGLPICALRADKMGGSLTLDTTVSRGTSFILTIHTQPV
ncbi:MAG: ATP-binding protein, partial [Duncaniella sp.]|nr:ATP-binding protein [Duncaniella sp.]